MYFQSRLFKNLITLILVLVAIFLFLQVRVIFDPFIKILATLSWPFFFSGLFYYLLRPVVNLLEKYRIKRPFGILLIFYCIAVVIAFFTTYVGPAVAELNEFTKTLPEKIVAVSKQTTTLLKAFTFDLISITDLQARLATYLQSFTQLITQNIVDILAVITNIATTLVLVPFILFYFLKDDTKFSSFYLSITPPKYRSEVKTVLTDVDTTLSTYIIGQLIVATIVGCLLFIGYISIGLNYPVVLATYAILFNTVPFIGPFIAIAPALLVALTISFSMFIKVLIVFIIVQQLEGNLIAPQIMGKRLDIHPLTVILIMLALGSLYGLIGVLVALPAYAVIRVIAVDIYTIYHSEK